MGKGVSNEWYTSENKGVSHAPVCCFSCRCFSNFGLEIDNTSATPSTYPTSSPNILFLLGGCTWTCKPFVCPFLLHWLFSFISYRRLPLFLPRPQIKQLGTLVSLPGYWSAKIKQFGQISFSILQHKLKTWHDPDLDCWVIHKLLCKCRPIHTFFSCKYGTFVTANNGSYLALILPIMKYKTYWYRYPTESSIKINPSCIL